MGLLELSSVDRNASFSLYLNGAWFDSRSTYPSIYNFFISRDVCSLDFVRRFPISGAAFAPSSLKISNVRRSVGVREAKKSPSET